jgi:hypothetical protein
MKTLSSDMYKTLISICLPATMMSARDGAFIAGWRQQ